MQILGSYLDRGKFCTPIEVKNPDRGNSTPIEVELGCAGLSVGHAVTDILSCTYCVLCYT